MVQRIIGVTELQRHFRTIFDEVTKKNVPYVLTRGSRPEAALISYEEFLLFQELQERDVLRLFDQLVDRMAQRSTEFTEKEVAADVAKAVAEAHE